MAKRRPKLPADPLLVVAYIRVSTDDQALGPEAQEDALARWCAKEGARRYATFRDIGVSGAAPLNKRPGLAEALDALAASGAGVLLVAKRDRLARDVMTAAYVEATAKKSGARVVSVAGEGEGDDPAARLMRTIVDAFAQYERDLIAARTQAALAVKKRRGELTGTAPYGKVAGDGGLLVDAPGEAAMVARAIELRASGLSFGDVADRLGAEGYVGRRGKPLHRVQVYNICRKVG